MSRSLYPGSRSLPTGKQRQLARARRLEWLALGLRASVVVVLYTVLSGTQALTAIWLKSLWALLPPIAFLVACRIEERDPTPRFPYGFHRATSIAFLTSALALTSMGLFLLYAGLHSFFAARHPGLETIDSHAGVWHWTGWPIMAALVYSIIVPFVAARSRRGLAVALHDKGLFADTTVGRMSWRASGAAALGVLGIGLGFWWADFVATMVIALDILWHGARHLHTAICDLTDEVPRRIGSRELDPLDTRIRARLESFDWIDAARVRLREEGRRLTGVALVCPTRCACDGHDLAARLDRARADIVASDWRLLDFELVPVPPARSRADRSRT